MPSKLRLRQKLKSLWTFLGRRLWWFDVFYPVALGVFLFAALSYSVYAGQRQWRLSLQAEKALLDFSLRQARRDAAPNQHEILVVSSEWTAPSGNLGTAAGAAPDASVAAYAQVIERLASSGVPLLFVRWDLSRHLGDEAGYFALGQVLAAHQASTCVYFVVPSDQGERLPSSLQQHAAWLDGAACGEPTELQSSCSYLPDYQQWAVQRILTTFSPSAASAAKLRWVSDQLPNAFPSYILQLRPLHERANRSFSWVLQAPQSDLAGWRAAFIGAGQTSQPLGAQEAAELLPTVYDRFSAQKPVTGTPLHAFLAMLAQMFVLGDEVRLPSGTLGTMMTGALCLVLTVITATCDVFVALAVLLALGLCAPLLNALLLRYARCYIPLFDSYYFGLSVIFVAGLVQLSLLSLQRWRLEALRRLNSRVADLKGNFISLLTHNLNTPVAKMQGMLGLLIKQAAGDVWLADALQAEALVAQLEFAIRSVLIAAALEEGVVQTTARNPRALMDELVASSVASLRRLGVYLSEGTIISVDDGAEFLPLLLDVRAVHAAISGVAALFHRVDSKVHLSVSMRVGASADAEGVGEGLEVIISSQEQWLSAEVVAMLTAPTTSQVRTSSDGQFFPAVLAGLAKLTVAAFQGQITVQPEARGGEVVLRFHTLGQASSPKSV
jgi:signal transduction histidine kinase